MPFSEIEPHSDVQNELVMIFSRIEACCVKQQEDEGRKQGDKNALTSAFEHSSFLVYGDELMALVTALTSNSLNNSSKSTMYCHGVMLTNGMIRNIGIACFTPICRLVKNLT